MVDDAPIRIVMSPSHPGDQVVKVRITPAHMDDLAGLAEARGFSTGEMIELSAGTELAILGIQAGMAVGGLAGLAAVLSAFFNKNQHKKITVTVGDTTVSVEGMSTDQSEASMLKLLEKVADQQRELDESWERIKKEWDERDADGK